MYTNIFVCVRTLIYPFIGFISFDQKFGNRPHKVYWYILNQQSQRTGTDHVCQRTYARFKYIETSRIGQKYRVPAVQPIGRFLLFFQDIATKFYFVNNTNKI